MSVRQAMIDEDDVSDEAEDIKDYSFHDGTPIAVVSIVRPMSVADANVGCRCDIDVQLLKIVDVDNRNDNAMQNVHVLTHARQGSRMAIMIKLKQRIEHLQKSVTVRRQWTRVR